jgi:hypothetical protein
MATLPPLSKDRMFLDPVIDQYVAHIRKAHASCFAFIERLNALGNRSLFSAEVDGEDLQELLLATLLRRALTSYQATVILGERGLLQEAQVMLRTLLEVTFKVAAIATDRKVADEYVRTGIANRENLLKKFNKLSPTTERIEAQEANRDLLDATSKLIKEQKIADGKVENYARTAGLSDLYYSAYTVLSQHVHVNIGTLEDTLDVDPAGDLVGLKYGPTDADLDHHLLAAAEALIIILRSISSVIDLSTADEISKLHTEFIALHEEVSNNE